MPPMFSETAEKIRCVGEEIIRLSDRQNEMLKLARVGGMSKAEADEYDARHSQIMKLVKELASLTQP